MKLNIEELITQAGGEFYAETYMVNGKDAHDFVETFARLIEERCTAGMCERPQQAQLQALSYEEIDAAVAPLYKNSAAQRMGRIDDISTAKVIQSALAAKNGAVLK